MMPIHRRPILPGGRTRLLLVAGVIVGLALGACASAAAPAPREVGAPDANAGPATGGGTDAFGNPLPMASAAGTAGPAYGGDTQSSGRLGAANPGDATPPQQLSLVNDTAYIVKTGSMTLEVPAIDQALLKARTAILGLGGYISGSEQSNDGDRAMASITYRFPAARWEDALDALRGLATKVVGLKTATDEVTGQVLDLGARIDNLKSTERALQAIMVKAVKIQDILDVQNQLTSVQGQIEELSTQQARLKDQAAMSTLTVLFQAPAVAAVKETTKGWDPGTEFDRAVSQLLGLGQGLATAAIWLGIVVLPVLVGLAFVLLFLTVIVRRLGWLPIRRPVPPAIVGGPEA
jgi:hypothetical protein